MGVFPVMGNIPPIRAYTKDRVKCILVEPLNVNSVAKGIIDSLNLDEESRREARKINYELVRNEADFNKEMKKMEEWYYQLIEGKE